MNTEENVDMEANYQEPTVTENQDEVVAEETKEVEVNSEDLLAAEKDKYIRLFAEFENYKKRTSKERIELFKTAGKDIIVSMLPVVDDFERAMVELQKTEDEALIKGVELIQEKFVKTLEQKGLTLIEVKAGDDFDADTHEAITQIPAPTEDLKGKIIDVVEKGYKLGETIIRYPKVVIGMV